MNEVRISKELQEILDKHIRKAFPKYVQIKYTYDEKKRNIICVDVIKKENKLISFSNDYVRIYSDILVSELWSKIIYYKKITAVKTFLGEDSVVISLDNSEIVIKSELIEKIPFIAMVQEIIALQKKTSKTKKIESVEKKGSVDYSKLRPINKNLGVSNKYDRKKYEDKAAMERYRQSRFSNKNTVQCDYTGETIHKSHTAAKNKYGENSYANHAAEVEHIYPLKQGHDECKKSIFGNLVKDEQLNKSLNSENNFAMINKSSNCAKRDYSCDEYISRNSDISQETKDRIKNRGKQAQKKVKRGIHKDAAKNISKGVAEGAVNGAIYGGVTRGVQSTREQIVVQKEAVQNGEKTKIQAIYDGTKEVAKDVGIEIIIGAEEGAIRAALEMVLKATGKTVVNILKSKF